MKKKFTIPNILFVTLMILASFLIGVLVVGITGAAKAQGLAGGAIVLGYGIIGAGVGLILSLVLASKLEKKIIVRANWVLLVALIGAFFYLQHNYTKRQELKQQEREKEMRQRTKPTSPSPINFFSMPVMASTFSNSDDISSVKMALGYYTPNHFEYKTMYFYEDINPEKGLTEHLPTDSVVFGIDKYGNPKANYAPKWFNPEHLKLDYGIIVLKVLSIGFDFMEVVVDSETDKRMYIDKFKGTYTSLPEYLLSANSLEFRGGNNNKIFEKPSYKSSIVEVDYSFMKPLLIEQNWAYVKLVDDSLKEMGKGWIVWKDKGELLVSYSLLS